MRYSRIRRKKKQRNYARVLLLGIVLFIAIYVASAGAIGKKLSSIIAPRLKFGEEKDKENGKEKDPVEQGDEKEGEAEKQVADGEKGTGEVEKVTETIKVEPLTVYTVQMGAFSTEENAKVLADEIKSRGGGGYIVHDEFHRVLAVGYIDEGDINSVREQLKEQDISCQIYQISTPGANMSVTTSREKLEGVKSAFSLWRENIDGLEKTIKELDSKTVTGESAYGSIKEMRDNLENTLAEIKGFTGSENGSAILDGLEVIYRDGLGAFEKLLDENYQDEVAFSAKIKYTSMEMVYIYKNYMDKIVGG